jgi:hypothetical protein
MDFDTKICLRSALQAIEVPFPIFCTLLFSIYVLLPFQVDNSVKIVVCYFIESLRHTKITSYHTNSMS